MSWNIYLIGSSSTRGPQTVTLVPRAEPIETRAEAERIARLMTADLKPYLSLSEMYYEARQDAEVQL